MFQSNVHAAFQYTALSLQCECIVLQGKLSFKPVLHPLYRALWDQGYHMQILSLLLKFADWHLHAINGIWGLASFWGV